MTVQELIDELMNIKDKEMKVLYRHGCRGTIENLEVSETTYTFFSGEQVIKSIVELTD